MTPELPGAWRRGLWVTAAAGLAVTAGCALVSPGKTWPNILLAAFYALGIGLGGLLFVAFGHVTGAGWSVVFRRVPEAMAATLPVGAAAMVVALLGLPLLYEWSHADAVAHDALLQAKSGWLDPGFFVLRSAAYLLCWLVFAAALLRTSRGQDASGDPAAAGRSRALAAAFIVAFFSTFSLACFDWLMSIEPHWFSTVFALLNFSGVFLSALAGITVLAIVLRRAGPLRDLLRPDHLHDLGKLVLAFATFRAYLWYCQHMLIWYGNIPEETAYYALREAGTWQPMLLLDPVLNWLIPFLALLPRPAKRSETVMLTVALLLLAGRWLDLGVQVLPPFGSPLGFLWGIGPVAAALSLTTLAVFKALRRAEPVPWRDPYLPESLAHHI